MKKRLTVIITAAVTILGLNAEVADVLKPEWQRQEQDLLRLMDKWVAEGMRYDIKVEEYTVAKTVRYSQKVAVGTIICFRHFVTLPPEIKEELQKVKMMDGFAREYLGSPKYSFAVAVLNIAFHKDGFSTKDKPLSAIINKNKNEWDKTGINIMLGQKYINGFQWHEQEYVQWEKRSEQDVFLRSIPAVYANKVPPPNVLLKKNSQRIGAKVKLLEQDITKEIARGRNAMSFKKFPETQETLEKWLHLCVHDEKERLADNRFGFIKWCRENKPATKPYLPAVAMALFTVDGYSFNDESGVYTMNGRGRMLMDFIAEFPIPENATRLQAVMGGGNKDEIEGMMKKHGTEAKWQELLKNPAHPAFAKYLQD